jgi:hypothetical protein
MGAPELVIGSITPGGSNKSMVWNGSKLVATADLKKTYATLNKDQKTALIELATLMGKTSSYAKTIWNTIVDGAASQYAISGKQVSPWDVYSTTKANLPIGTGLESMPTVTNYVTDYTKIADGLFAQEYKKMFNRLPTAEDDLSPYKDAQGNTLTWGDALKQEASKPENQETITYIRNPDGTSRQQVTSKGFDAKVWLQQNLATNYAEAIKSGKAQAAISDVDKYNSLASEYGYQTVDPVTKKLSGAAMLDLAELTAGTKSLDDIRSKFKLGAIAKGYGHLQPQLDSGITLKDLASPAITAISKTLGKNPNTITLDDPYVQMYLKGDGKSPMSPAQFNSKLRQDPSWPYTDNAKAEFEGLGSSLFNRMGLVG